MQSLHFKKDYRDYQRVATFKSSFMTGSDRTECSALSFAWKLQDNPGGEGTIFTAHDSDELVGLAAITRKDMLIEQEMVPGAEIGDTFTDERYRRRGIFSTLVGMATEECRERGIEFIYGAPNDNSLPGYRNKLGFRVIADLKIDYVVCPLRSAAALAKMFPAFGFAAPALGGAIDPVLRSLHFLKLGRKTRYAVRRADDFPETVNDLFREVAQDYDFIVTRTRQYLQWRFVEGPDRCHVFVSEDPDRKMVGYCVVALGSWKGIPVGYLIDYLISEQSREVLGGLLHEVMRFCRSNGVAMIAAWDLKGSWHSALLRGLGFLRFRDVPIICYDNDRGRMVLTRKPRFYFTMGDAL
jgi:GNAT superfamily N-acetyltransferase